MMEDTRSKILQSAKELFILQGYKKTTIRQIVERSGVLIGSIYYLYKNKEEIFKSLILETFKKSDEVICNYFGEDLNPVLRYGLSCAIELTAVEEDECICEIYYEAYSLKSVFDGLVDAAARRSQILFKNYNPDFEFEDYYIRTLAIKGAMRSFIANKYLTQKISLEKRIDMILDFSLQTYNVSQPEIHQVKKHIVQLKNQMKEFALSIKED